MRRKGAFVWLPGAGRSRPKADPGTDAQRLSLLPHFCRWPPSAGSLGEKPTFGVAAAQRLSLVIPQGSTGRPKLRPGIRCSF
jgi:hypothetical protein